MSGHTGRSFTGAALVFLGLETFAVGFLFFGFCGSSLFPVGERVQAIVCPNPSQGTASEVGGHVPVPAFTRAIEKHSMRAQGRARPPRPVAHAPGRFFVGTAREGNREQVSPSGETLEQPSDRSSPL